MQKNKISILGTLGVPARYGGFETLAENLVKYHHAELLPNSLIVYCSSRNYPSKSRLFLFAQLKYVPFNANGVQSILYDITSLLSAIWNRSDTILLLGVSGAIVLPFVRLFSSVRIVTNIDGIEWRRAKWLGLARKYLRFSEKMAVRFSHEIIADNHVIAEYVEHTYGTRSNVIAYGGDHAVVVDSVAVDEYNLPHKYAFSVCRIEPENNVHIILEAFSKIDIYSLVIVGNWGNNAYGRMVRERFSICKNIFLLDPIYDLGKLKTLRSQVSFYVHGHSAGGTNPSLVEAMHFGKPVLAFDCEYNRITTEEKALYFGDSKELHRLIESMSEDVLEKVGLDMLEIANRRYTWHIVAEKYFTLLGK